MDCQNVFYFCMGVLQSQGADGAAKCTHILWLCSHWYPGMQFCCVHRCIGACWCLFRALPVPVQCLGLAIRYWFPDVLRYVSTLAHEARCCCGVKAPPAALMTALSCMLEG